MEVGFRELPSGSFRISTSLELERLVEEDLFDQQTETHRMWLFRGRVGGRVLTIGTFYREVDASRVLVMTPLQPKEDMVGSSFYPCLDRSQVDIAPTLPRLEHTHIRKSLKDPR